MPPKTVWEWVEAYGALQTDPAKAHGDWESAKAEAASCLNAIVTEAEMEALLQSTKQMAKSPAKEVLFASS